VQRPPKCRRADAPSRTCMRTAAWQC
jgi:hypothetical protein